MKSRKSESLKSKIIIERLFKKETKTIYSKSFKIAYLKNKVNTLRWVIAASKKKFTTAPLRNNAKRKIRMLLQDIDLPGYDLAIFASENFKTTKFSDLKIEFNELINKIK
ncbi:MAG: ribonuclease P protein component [Mycoplasmataceae bacterium]|nr:ribonuclease P protein component [Mycoplasmataceae bacterium]